MRIFDPTPEQKDVINHKASAFISACPGAGKTKCIVERARSVFSDKANPKALAFLSFTNAAVDELEKRLTNDQILPHPVFPHFVGTFDSFIWHFMVAPFGIEGVKEPLRLVADKKNLMVRPYPKSRSLPLECFNRVTGKIIPEQANRHGFQSDSNRHESCAAKLRETLISRGQVDFDDVRDIAQQNLKDDVFSQRLGIILAARFGEVIVDEAQDCNPDDLGIIDWIRKTADITTKVVCDPHQSIYGFRGGVTDDLFNYAAEFPESEQKFLTGNFRSTTHICKAVYMLRAPNHRGDQDEGLGEFKDLDIKVHVFSYQGAVSANIGEAFAKLIREHEIDSALCRVTAKTRASGKRAVGITSDKVGEAMNQRLADAALSFQHATSPKEKRDALIEVHKITLTLSGQMGNRTYHQTLIEDNIIPLSWRGDMVNILHSLEFDPVKGHTRSEWVSRARNCLGPYLDKTKGTIAQKIPDAKKLDGLLGVCPVHGLSPRTIHEVKGKQYPAMCVVMTSNTAKGILDHLENKTSDKAEQAREIYVAASRAEKLLCIACPSTQAERLMKHLESGGAKVQLEQI